MLQSSRYLLFIAMAAMLASPSTQADSARAECGFGGSVDAPRGETSACTFSQRQGYINIVIDGGAGFDLRPTGDAPGNYIGADGQAVYRRSGLGDQGLIFKLPDQFLFVYWALGTTACDGALIASQTGCQLVYDGIVFSLHYEAEPPLGSFTIQANGLAGGEQIVTHEIDGAAYRAEVADLDVDGSPEVYVYISSADSRSYGSLLAYAVNDRKSMTPIYLRPLSEDAAVSEGYMGRDEFAVVENRLVQRFPVYRDGDNDNAPSGGMRQLQYRLVPGEAGWVLETDRVVAY